MAGLDEQPSDVHQTLDVLTAVTIKREIHHSYSVIISQVQLAESTG